MSMNRDAIKGLREAETEGLKQGPSGDERMAHMALLQSMQGIATTLERVVDRQDRHDEKLDSVGDAVHAVDKRLAVVESTSVAARLDKLEAVFQTRVREVEVDIEELKREHHQRLDTLEADRDRKAGERSTVEKIFTSPPLAWALTAVSAAVAYIATHVHH